MLRKAERLIESCEACNSKGAEIPFDNVLDRVAGSDPSLTDYLLEAVKPGARNTKGEYENYVLTCKACGRIWYVDKVLFHDWDGGGGTGIIWVPYSV